eukprot:m.229719 g.229719  ORF g.229719 m.229719 type:complete len:156 (-) comp13886_c0_seq4:2420-2887(-)
MKTNSTFLLKTHTLTSTLNSYQKLLHAVLDKWVFDCVAYGDAFFRINFQHLGHEVGEVCKCLFVLVGNALIVEEKLFKVARWCLELHHNNLRLLCDRVNFVRLELVVFCEMLFFEGALTNHPVGRISHRTEDHLQTFTYIKIHMQLHSHFLFYTP